MTKDLIALAVITAFIIAFMAWTPLIAAALVVRP